MKQISTYISERLKIDSNIQGYNYYPRTKEELRERPFTLEC